MRSKLIIVISLVMLVTIGVTVYINLHRKSIDDYIVDDVPFYETKIGAYEFYVDSIDDATAINVSNTLELLGVDYNVSVSDMYLSEDLNEMDMDRDAIISYTQDIDFSKPVYTVFMGGIYYVYYDKSGNIRGMHLDNEYNLIELR